MLAPKNKKKLHSMAFATKNGHECENLNQLTSTIFMQISNQTWT